MERFWSKVEKSKDCWVWRAACENGYPIFRFEGKSTRAKRVAFILEFGNIPRDQVVASTCRNNLCVNPAHLALAPHANTQISDPVERFWMKVEKTESCWLWTAAINKTGYGDFYASRTKHVLAHRFSWVLHYGPVPDGLFVCHHCDNPRCVRPDHLWLGTTQENTADMLKKGRHRFGTGQPHDHKGRFTNRNKK